MDERKVLCPYCQTPMRFVASLSTNIVKGYFHCGECYARSPRVRMSYVDDFGSSTKIPTRSEVPETLREIEEKAYVAANQEPPLQFDFDDDFDKIFAIDDIEEMAL